MTYDLEDLGRRVDRIEGRLEFYADRISEHRTTIMDDIATIRTQLALGEQAHANIGEKIDKLSAQVEELIQANTVRRAQGSVWERVFDPFLKIFVAVAVAYMIFWLKLK